MQRYHFMQYEKMAELTKYCISRQCTEDECPLAYLKGPGMCDLSNPEKFDDNLKLISMVEGYEALLRNNKLEQSDILLVKYEDRKTTIIFSDGSSTSVTCNPEDVYSKEAGFAFAFLKHMCMSNSQFRKIVEKFTK